MTQALTGEIGTKKDQVAANAVTQEGKDKEIDDLMKLIEDTTSKIAATKAKIEPLPSKIEVRTSGHPTLTKP